MVPTVDSASPRRDFLGRLAAGSLALGFGGILPAPLRAASAARAKPLGAPGAEDWPAVKGKHRQVYDAVSPNNGMSLLWSMVFLNTHNQASKLPDKDIGVVVVHRHEAIPLALTDPVWEKYKLGEAFNVTDPATKKPAIRNPYYHPKPGELMLPGMEVDKLLARGVRFGVCRVALTVISAMNADRAGVSKDEATKDWLAGVIPGITIVPSGVWAVNRAQEVGCTYCYAG